MKLQFCSLASGSSGNCYVVQTETTSLVIDAGISAKKIREGLERLGAQDTFQGVLITHEHSDHVKGVSTVSRRFSQVGVYATEGTWNHMNHTVCSDQQRLVEANRNFFIGDLEVRPFSVSHDAASPVGYTVCCEDKQITILTDTGCFSEDMLNQAEDADLLVLEANHDVDMLRVSRYPWFLKQRILGAFGHLSNETAGKGLVELLNRSKKKRRVCLAHLSRENNFPEMAYQTVKNILEDADYYIGDQVEMEILRRDGISGMYEL